MSDSAPRPRPGRSRSAIAPVDDIDAVMAIMATAFEPTYGEAWTRSQCAGILPMAGVSLRLAEEGDGEVAGFRLAPAVADEAELLLIAVDPGGAEERHRRGAGR